MGIEFAQGGDLLPGFDHTGVDEVGDLPAGLGGEVTEFQDSGLFQKLNKFSFVGFQLNFLLSLQIRKRTAHRQLRDLPRR